MSPILGIYASSITPYLKSNSYESISTVTVGAGGSSTITFSSIPSTYKHLQIRALSRSTVSGDYDYLLMTTNSDTAANYAYHAIYGNGSTANASATTSITNIRTGFFIPGGINQASTFAGTVIDILDYTNTSKYKTVRTLGGFDDNNYPSTTNGKGQAYLSSGLWQSTSAITSIQLFASVGNISQYSSFALYGIK